MTWNFAIICAHFSYENAYAIHVQSRSLSMLLTLSANILAPSIFSALPGKTLQRSYQAFTLAYLLKLAPSSLKWNGQFTKIIFVICANYNDKTIQFDQLTTTLAIDENTDKSASVACSLPIRNFLPSRNVFSSSTVLNNSSRLSAVIFVWPL